VKIIINTPNAPAPIGPYSQAVLSLDTLYLSGQICIDPKTGNLTNSNIESETKQVMANLSAVLKEAGFTFSDVVKTTIFLRNLSDFSTVNAVYGASFTADFPARETVEVSRLPKDVNVEISCIAVK